MLQEGAAPTEHEMAAHDKSLFTPRLSSEALNEEWHVALESLAWYVCVWCVCVCACKNGSLKVCVCACKKGSLKVLPAELVRSRACVHVRV
jgi:hypothetical protein